MHVHSYLDLTEPMQDTLRAAYVMADADGTCDLIHLHGSSLPALIKRDLIRLVENRTYTLTPKGADFLRDMEKDRSTDREQARRNGDERSLKSRALWSLDYERERQVARASRELERWEGVVRAKRIALLNAQATPVSDEWHIPRFPE
jgi:hypothetical protein